MTLAINISNLTKTYNSKFSKQNKTALDDVSLQIPQGSFFGLLGPNGAGKSTMINIIAGMVNKTSGRVEINGFDLDESPEKVKNSIGVVPQEVVIDPFFSVFNTLEYYAGYYGIPKGKRRTDEILKALNLEDKRNLNPRRLSGGMKRRLLIAKALVHTPPIIILDEPTAGVDVELRQQLWDYVRELNKQGTTVLLTTHYLEEAEQLCDKIAVINHGKIIANDTTQNLKSALGVKKISFRFSNQVDANSDIFKNLSYEKFDNGYGVKITHNKDSSLNEIISNFTSAGFIINDITSEESDLEDVFKILVAKR